VVTDLLAEIDGKERVGVMQHRNSGSHYTASRTNNVSPIILGRRAAGAAIPILARQS
jgi:hypothetical protein